MKHTISNTPQAIRSSNQSAQKTRKRGKKLQEQEGKRTEVTAKYKNLQKIHEYTKKENKIYQTEILKINHEKDTAAEVMKALGNANFNKIQISSAADKE